MANTVKTKDQRQTERDVKVQDRTLSYVQDLFVQDAQGNIRPAPPGPSIFDV